MLDILYEIIVNGIRWNSQAGHIIAQRLKDRCQPGNLEPLCSGLFRQLKTDYGHTECKGQKSIYTSGKIDQLQGKRSCDAGVMGSEVTGWN